MERELAQVSSAIREAGKRAMDLARKGFEVQIKKDRSPVTTADLEVNRVLHEMQETYFPDDGWLSEESPDDPARLEKARVWIVDPIDGTKAYVNKLPEYCISVGLVEAGMPVLGAVLNPSTDELFTATARSRPSLEWPARRPCGPGRSTDQRSWSTYGNIMRGRWADLDGRIHCRPMLSIAHAIGTCCGRACASRPHH